MSQKEDAASNKEVKIGLCN